MNDWAPSAYMSASNFIGDTMFQGRKAILWIIGVILGCLLAIHYGLAWVRYYQSRPIVLTGAMIKQDVDPIKRAPIMDVEVSEANGLASKNTKSTFAGYFEIPLVRGV